VRSTAEAGITVVAVHDNRLALVSALYKVCDVVVADVLGTGNVSAPIGASIADIQEHRRAFIEPVECLLSV